MKIVSKIPAAAFLAMAASAAYAGGCVSGTGPKCLRDNQVNWPRQEDPNLERRLHAEAMILDRLGRRWFVSCARQTMDLNSDRDRLAGEVQRAVTDSDLYPRDREKIILAIKKADEWIYSRWGAGCPTRFEE